MNISGTTASAPGANPKNDLLYINFNQDQSCLLVGTKGGFRVFNCDPFGHVYSKDGGGVGIVETLFSTNLVAITGGGDSPMFSSRKLRILNIRRETVICELSFTTPIISIRMNRKRLIVVLEEKIHIFDISNMKILSVLDTSPNRDGTVALSPNSENSFLAYPNLLSPQEALAASQDSNTNVAGAESGANSGLGLVIYDANSMQPMSQLEPHQSRVVAITFSQDGKLLASASETGTIIRVMDMPHSKAPRSFRRGTYPKAVSCLSFSPDNAWLVASSESETVHVFKLDMANANAGNASNGGSAGPFSVLNFASSYIPKSLTDMWEPMRDFARFRLPNSGYRTLCSIGHPMPYVTVVSSQGNVYQFLLDIEKGGEGPQARRYSILENSV